MRNMVETAYLKLYLNLELYLSELHKWTTENLKLNSDKSTLRYFYWTPLNKPHSKGLKQAIHSTLFQSTQL